MEISPSEAAAMTPGRPRAGPLTLPGTINNFSLTSMFIKQRDLLNWYQISFVLQNSFNKLYLL